MKVLVVGGNGFVGSHLVDGLALRSWQVTVLDAYHRRYDELPAQVQFIQGDLTQTYLLREALAGVELVYHLAWASIHETSNQNLAEDIQANLLPSVHLLENCRWAGVRRVVYTSSGGTVYGPSQQTPIPETHPNQPINSYGILKLAVEKYLHMFRRLYGLEYAILRPSVPYGPRQNPLGRQGAVAVFMHRIAKGLPLTIYGDGSASRDYFYISDLVEALIACAERPLGDEPVYNIGGQRAVTLVELAGEIEKVVGQKAALEFHPARPFDAPEVALDTQRAQGELGWAPRTPLAEGLRQTWDWMKAAIKE